MKRHLLSLFVVLLAAARIHGYVSNPPYYADYYMGAGGARGMAMDDVGDLLVKCAFSNGGIIAVFEETDQNGDIKIERVDIASGSGLNLNHGVAYRNGYLFASSATTVYRWPYTSGQRTLITEGPTIVINSMPTGGHDTRTIEFDSQGRLYVSCGSGGNVDQNSDRARIRRFNIEGFPNGGINFNQGEVFADGLRNEVGLAFDADGILWGVENGADQASRPDFGGDIHNGNPCEEINKFDGPPGTHHGYPYCFSSYILENYEKGTQFAWDSFMTDGIHSDEWCRNQANNKPPAFCMPPHQAPLGITFYDGRGCDSTEGSFPCSAIGDAFVSLHGSWNSDIPTGYRVAWFPFNKETGMPTGEDIEIMSDFRAVNALFNNRGHLIVSSDSAGQLIRVAYNSPPTTKK